jgi:hypothetical protein
MDLEEGELPYEAPPVVAPRAPRPNNDQWAAAAIPKYFPRLGRHVSDDKPFGDRHGVDTCRSKFEILNQIVNEYSKVKNYVDIANQFQSCIEARITDEERLGPEIGHARVIDWMIMSRRFIVEYVIPNQASFSLIVFNYIKNPHRWIVDLYGVIEGEHMRYLVDATKYVKYFGGFGRKQKAKRKTHKRKNKKSKTRRNRRK